MFVFFITLYLIFIAEIGDKTQLLIVGLATKGNYFKILIGIAIGSLLSHGLAITIGSYLTNFSSIQNYIQILAYLSFIILGIYSLFKKEKNGSKEETLRKTNNIIFTTAMSIFFGELGDKTELTSIALGMEYPNSTFAILLGAIGGMLLANIIAILVGAYINKKVSQKIISKISAISFIIFGIIGLIYN